MVVAQPRADLVGVRVPEIGEDGQRPSPGRVGGFSVAFGPVRVAEVGERLPDVRQRGVVYALGSDGDLERDGAAEGVAAFGASARLDGERARHRLWFDGGRGRHDACPATSTAAYRSVERGGCRRRSS